MAANLLKKSNSLMAVTTLQVLGFIGKENGFKNLINMYFRCALQNEYYDNQHIRHSALQLACQQRLDACLP